MSSVHRSQQLFLAEEKLPRLLTGVLQAVVWASPQGHASGTVQETPGLAAGPRGSASLGLCLSSVAVNVQPAWRPRCARLPQPGQAPFLRLGVRMGTHFAFKVGVSAAHPARARVRGAGTPVPCWGPVANPASLAQALLLLSTIFLVPLSF